MAACGSQCGPQRRFFSVSPNYIGSAVTGEASGDVGLAAVQCDRDPTDRDGRNHPFGSGINDRDRKAVVT